jgi:hypothetical protein
MLNLNATDMRAFLPATDFVISKAFYAALGWTLTEINDELALIELAGRKL